MQEQDLQSTRTRLRTATGALVLVAGLVVAATTALLLLARCAATARTLSAGPSIPATPDDVLAALAAGGAGLLLLWLVTGAALAALASVPGALGRAARAASMHVAPIIVRTVVATVIGAVVTTGAEVSSYDAAPVAARVSSSQAGSLPAARSLPAPRSLTGPTPYPGRPSPQHPASGLPAPGWPVDDLPAPGWTPRRPPPPTTKHVDVGLAVAAPAAGRTLDEHVVVRRGDTLWAIAARRLGPEASALRIAQAWPRWYAANRGVIGADPDRLLPGQILVPPRTDDRTGDAPGRERP